MKNYNKINKDLINKIKLKLESQGLILRNITNEQIINIALELELLRISKESIINTNKNPDYERAFNILMEYFNYLPEEDKKVLDKKLRECGL